MESNLIFTPSSVKPQLDILLQKYPYLQVVQNDEQQIRLHGYIQVNRVAKDYPVCKEYLIDIVIPLSSHKLPYVIDTGHVIKSSYPHQYESSILCLETDSRIRIHFVNGFNLVEWMDRYVETYFFSYEYWLRFGVFPFGDRTHGVQGILESYMDIFEVNSIHSAYYLMSYIAKSSYRGHLPCPCGSGRRIRDCHGDKIEKFCNSSNLRSIVLSDLSLCNQEFAGVIQR